jgi:hypothetical protein
MVVRTQSISNDGIKKRVRRKRETRVIQTADLGPQSAVDTE